MLKLTYNSKVATSRNAGKKNLLIGYFFYNLEPLPQGYGLFLEMKKMLASFARYAHPKYISDLIDLALFLVTNFTQYLTIGYIDEAQIASADELLFFWPMPKTLAVLWPFV
jgi:hypothetical protein